MGKPFEIKKTYLPGDGNPEEFEQLYRDVRYMARIVFYANGTYATVFYSGQSDNLAQDVIFAVQRKSAWERHEAPDITAEDVHYLAPDYAWDQMNLASGEKTA